MSSNYLTCKRMEPYSLPPVNAWDCIKLYFLDDGSLIIDKHTSITLIPSEQFEIVRTIGCHYLSNLSGKEAYDSLVSAESSPLDKNELSNSHKPVGAGNQKTK